MIFQSSLEESGILAKFQIYIELIPDGYTSMVKSSLSC